MKVTPLDIRKKSFEKVTFGGYNKEDVNTFLVALSTAWEQVMQRNAELENRIQNMAQEVSRLRDIESSLLRTLKNLEDSNHTLKEQARKESELIIREGQMKASHVLEDARLKAKAMMRDANQYAFQSLSEMREDLRKLDYSYRLLEKQKDLLLNELKGFMKDTSGKIDQIETYRRTVFYEEEIKKANSFMQQSNQQVRQELHDLENLVQQTIHYRQPQTDDKQAQSSARPSAPANDKQSDLSSFFDSL
jgi:cell division initiation protein